MQREWRMPFIIRKILIRIYMSRKEENKITIPEGVDPELLMKVLSNPEMAALLTSLAKTMKV